MVRWRGDVIPRKRPCYRVLLVEGSIIGHPSFVRAGVAELEFQCSNLILALMSLSAAIRIPRQAIDAGFNNPSRIALLCYLSLFRNCIY
jgi:hypothetical protein